MRRILFTSSFLACILACSVSRAQTTGGIHPGENPAITGIAIGGPVGVMTDEQRASYQTTLRAMHGQIAELDAKLRAARQDVLDTTLTTKFDENVIREKAFAAARIEAELAVIRAKALSQVQPPLSAEQIEKIKNGRPGPMHPIEHAPRREAPPETNNDKNGLPPKQ
jgi:Spy/CpxP family protein refolding chaperone